jgi:MoaA/NifB/PqqE/SkfB family radical SAM enzyme
MYKYSDIRHVHLEISTRCNAACPGCPRNLCGVDVIDDFPLHDMTLAEAERIFTPQFIKQLNKIHINGNLGDFVTARHGLDIVRYFRQHNKHLVIDISTNAGVKSDIWVELAQLNIIVIFCIDGLEGTHELYRQQTRWSTVVGNAKNFIQAGGRAIWKMIKFDHNRHQEEECRQLSKQLGFKEFEFVDHGRNAFPVFDQKGRYKHSIGTHSNPTTFKQVLWIRRDGMDNKHNPIVNSKKISCKSVNERSVYISATGEVSPCCWLGFYPRTMYHLGNPEIADLLPANNNAVDIGLEPALEWFDTIEKSWSGDQLYICNTVCGS